MELQRKLDDTTSNRLLRINGCAPQAIKYENPISENKLYVYFYKSTACCYRIHSVQVPSLEEEILWLTNL